MTAVFAGHIHRMRYDAKDGIEYVTLASTGSGQNGAVPEAGWLHHYHVVTVRKAQVAMAAFPVGTAMDVREITGELTEQTLRLSRAEPKLDAPIAMGPDGSAQQLVKVRIVNPTTRSVEYTIVPESDDSRWGAAPDHEHVTLAAGGEATVPFRVRRVASPLDDSTLRALEFVVDADYLAPSHRYAVPTRRVPLPMEFDAAVAQPNALDLSGNAALPVPPTMMRLPGKQFTLETHFLARSYKDRQGLLSKMQNSGYGIFVNNGRPTASAFIGDRCLTVRAPRRCAWTPTAGTTSHRSSTVTSCDCTSMGASSRVGTVRVN
ncbi:MAG TPA: hypothetical protein VGN72_13305 [Tepidisphaeraceae bacterium]|nr:hypothetical protein [Tepidisphaeraceae bacterium]